MNKKIFIQITLTLIILSIILIFFFYFYQKDGNQPNLSKENNKINKQIDPTKDQENQTNVMKDLKYLSKDINGNLYEIKAKSGQIDKDKPNEILMKNVTAKITSKSYENILLKADNAVYNNSNYDTNFINNVQISYSEHKMKSDKVDLLFSQDKAIIYENILYTSLNTKLLADIIELDIITKNLKILMNHSEEKVKIIYNN
tara:strand:- start:3316 stop:3918 length:603 start_codon:yes stop_codon:yes gene_type:complete